MIIITDDFKLNYVHCLHFYHFSRIYSYKVNQASFSKLTRQSKICISQIPIRRKANNLTEARDPE